MGERAKSSRKGKKAWRANINAEDIEDFYEKSTKDVLSDGSLTQVPTESLFFVDKSTDLGVRRKIEKNRDKEDDEVDGSDIDDDSDALEDHDSDGVEDDENDGLEDDSNGDDDDDVISGEEEEGEDDEEMEDAEKEERDMAEVEELEKEYTGLRHQEQDLLRNLRQQKDEDVLKGQAVKNQKALWDKTLELRFLLQKAFSNSNRLPQDPIRSSFCDSSSDTSEAYSDLITSSKKTLDSILKLQEALLEKNPTITQGTDGSSRKKTKQSKDSENSTEEEDHEWLKISEMQSRIVSFRDKAVDKWQRKAQVTTGAAALKGKLQAFNQSISDQVSAYMRDPSRMVNGMQQRRSAVSVFGMDSETSINTKAEEVNGDPELLDDSEFYQQLLKEFFETIDPTSSGKYLIGIFFTFLDWGFLLRVSIRAWTRAFMACRAQTTPKYTLMLNFTKSRLFSGPGEFLRFLRKSGY